MLGGIYSDEKCPLCGATFIHREPRGMFCPVHEDQRPARFKVIFKNVTRRFGSYDLARRFLTGLRYDYDQGTFDARDYKRDNPMGFASLMERYLEIKQDQVSPGHFSVVRRTMVRAAEAWKQRNIKTLGYGEIEDFLQSHRLADKTKANMCSVLRDFWAWLRKRKVLTGKQIPEFPEIRFELGYRKTISKATQGAILEEVKRVTWQANPRVYLGIRWLSIYIALRPGELVKIKESDIDLENGYLLIQRPKEKKAKMIPLLEEDVELIRDLPRGLPHLRFFRHPKGIQGVEAGRPFGVKYFYYAWKRACANLGIEGVDLYGGTRHSTARALREWYSPEHIMEATMHSTNKAFKRYLGRPEDDDLRSMYRKADAKNIHKGHVIMMRGEKKA